MKTTHYFETEVRAKRPYLLDEWCEWVLRHAERIEDEIIVPTGERRIRHYAFVPELGKYMRVVTLADGETVHNAFPDRSYKP